MECDRKQLKMFEFSPNEVRKMSSKATYARATVAHEDKDVKKNDFQNHSFEDRITSLLEHNRMKLLCVFLIRQYINAFM